MVSDAQQVDINVDDIIKQRDRVLHALELIMPLLPPLAFKQAECILFAHGISFTPENREAKNDN